jgi:hypothetical protein
MQAEKLNLNLKKQMPNRTSDVKVESERSSKDQIPTRTTHWVGFGTGNVGRRVNWANLMNGLLVWTIAAVELAHGQQAVPAAANLSPLAGCFIPYQRR